MAPQYKLTYFNLRGRGETVRLILAHAGIEYDDFRVESSEWPAFKSKMPWGKMPVLEVLEGDSKGFRLSDSVAIIKYLARKHNLAGATDEETATCDEYVGAINDLSPALVAYNYEKDEEKKTELEKKLFGETFPYYLEKFNSILEKNGTYLVGESLTYADIFVANFLQVSTSLNENKEILKNYPAVKTHQSIVFGLPTIKTWIKKRPVQKW